MGYAFLNGFDESKSAVVFRNENARQYYKDNSDLIKSKVVNRIRLHSLRLDYIKHKSGCAKCDENDYLVLEFNHINPETKSFNIGKTKGKSKSWSTILNEVKKCEILCANCHKRVTAREHGRRGYTSRVCHSGMPT